MEFIIQQSLKLVESGLVPDQAIRTAIRALSKKRLIQEGRYDPEQAAQRYMDVLTMLKNSEIAIETDKANEQHYELPTEFFQTVLGKRLKYSACYFPHAKTTLDEAEEFSLQLYSERAKLALRFFSFVSPFDFFFGTEWNPGFSTSGSAEGSYGLLPLLWGTLMVSGIALLVSVPVGLMIAIYLAEYASSTLRAWVKPAIEILAGIPTIVYGVFALMIIGPFFKMLGEMVGISINATSALTAGFVMGIMIIPFVSSLSDDIITQVPRALRDGSLGLGATKSETIRQVVIPAALPGIIGAFLLAASRAIGETMIVVLAAGNSPLLHVNPLEAVSTVTVTIVNQLTGDTDFASPQALVAFALGLTLFVITLGLNIVALYIVRKYREQYE